MQTFWDSVWFWLKKLGRLVAKYLLAPGAALLIFAAAILLVSIGVKNIQIGGLLGKLLGRKEPEHKATEVINTIPEDRIDDNGKLIPIGTPDDKGFKQVDVRPIQEPGLFSDPNTVTFKDPQTNKSVEVALPKGVSADHVDQVVVISPTITAITVRDSSGIETEVLDDILKKYE